ncbi:unnamed protein product, partial [Mesorhabditis spiculigera]
MLARISPIERSSQRRSVSFGDALWFLYCSLMQQSSMVPRGMSTRLLSLVWWLFALMLVSSYTANLAATATAKRMETPIEGAEDLSKQSRIRYGTLKKGSTMTFFKESKIETYERMWKSMSEEGGRRLVESSKEGISRVQHEEYAYLMESSMLEYAVERHCDLAQVGGLIDQKGYGIGLPKGSPYRAQISRAILRLQEKTILTELKNKWWKDKSHSCGAPMMGVDEDGGPVAGLALCLLGGLVSSTVFAITQFIASIWPRDETPIQSAPTLSALLSVAVLGIKAPGEVRRKFGRLDGVVEAADLEVTNSVLGRQRTKRAESLPTRKDRVRKRTLTPADMKALGF